MPAGNNHPEPTVTLSEYLASPELYPELDILDEEIGSVPRREPSSPDLWGSIPDERRVAWSKVFLTFKPVWVGTAAMNGTYGAVRRGRYTTISRWVPVAHAFEAVGFTPDSYYVLRTSLPRVVHEEGHPLIRVVPQKSGPRSIALRAADWAIWPQLVDAGMTPGHATAWVLAQGTLGLPDDWTIDDEGRLQTGADE
ncbi:hypothetical protein [Diaminobutyricimonas sp. LJ205]|uniref:hypothetical protein n=1 Tax=Diaminobutyricimonas sp. LJ205 TaxID=2683590 RepID=UPI0012F4BB3D|nr:hypothetical protein [Diaminobutyricimonas sp. LJ205]